MIFLQFIFGLLMYVGIASISYSDYMKGSRWYYPLGIFFSIFANIIWLSISKQESDPSKLLIKGLYWDAMLTLVYLFVPIMFYEAKITFTQSIGVTFVFLGLLLTKI